jgi:hypothetical protein
MKTDHFGAPSALASTPDNDTLLIEPVDSSRSQLWYFGDTGVDDYYRLHTEDKGDDYALSTYNYEGSQTIDLRFKAREDADGQYWRLDQQSDGSVKLSNNQAGPDTYLDVEDGSLKPMLAARDSPNQEWTISSLGSPTSTQSPIASSSHTASSSTFKTTTTPATSSSCISKCSATSTPSDTPSDSKTLGTGKIIGIAVGAAGILALVIGLILLWRWWKRKQAVEPPPPILPMRDGFMHG